MSDREPGFPEIYISQENDLFTPGTAVHGELHVPMFGEADDPFRPATTTSFVVAESLWGMKKVEVVVLFVGTDSLQSIRFMEQSLTCGKFLLKMENGRLASESGPGLYTLTVNEIKNRAGRKWIWTAPQLVSEPPKGMFEYALDLVTLRESEAFVSSQ